VHGASSLRKRIGSSERAPVHDGNAEKRTRVRSSSPCHTACSFALASVDSFRNFSVTVLTQPVGQSCTIYHQDGSGYGPADANVNVVCTPNSHTLGGTLNGLAPGTTITLQNNDTNSLALAANGSFNLPTKVRYGDVIRLRSRRSQSHQRGPASDEWHRDCAGWRHLQCECDVPIVLR
jgi:hypothetical protein